MSGPRNVKVKSNYDYKCWWHYYYCFILNSCRIRKGWERCKKEGFFISDCVCSPSCELLTISWLGIQNMVYGQNGPRTITSKYNMCLLNVLFKSIGNNMAMFLPFWCLYKLHSSAKYLYYFAVWGFESLRPQEQWWGRPLTSSNLFN